MQVADVMTRSLELVTPDVTVQQAALTMAEHDIGAVLVGTMEQVEGVLTDRDIILRVVVEGRDVAQVPVRDVMSSAVFTCRPTDSVEDALAQMDEQQVRRLPVLDPEGKLVGIVTRRALLEAQMAKSTTPAPSVGQPAVSNGAAGPPDGESHPRADA